MAGERKTGFRRQHPPLATVKSTSVYSPPVTQSSLQPGAARPQKLEPLFPSELNPAPVATVPHIPVLSEPPEHLLPDPSALGPFLAV